MRGDTDLVTLSEAARRLGVSNLSAYRSHYGGFPAPAKGVVGADVYRMGDVRDWYAAAVAKPRRKA